MLAALPIVLGLQALLAALSYDMANVPTEVRWLTFVALAVGLPFLAYHTIERPMIALGVRLSERSRRRHSAVTAAAVAPAP
jgi:peptidoglycan/LPS O-acetylase OafA/YrhL